MSLASVVVEAAAPGGVAPVTTSAARFLAPALAGEPPNPVYVWDRALADPRVPSRVSDYSDSPSNSPSKSGNLALPGIDTSEEGEIGDLRSQLKAARKEVEALLAEKEEGAWVDEFGRAPTVATGSRGRRGGRGSRGGTASNRGGRLRPLLAEALARAPISPNSPDVTSRVISDNGEQGRSRSPSPLAHRGLPPADLSPSRDSALSRPSASPVMDPAFASRSSLNLRPLEGSFPTKNDSELDPTDKASLASRPLSFVGPAAALANELGGESFIQCQPSSNALVELGPSPSKLVLDAALATDLPVSQTGGAITVGPSTPRGSSFPESLRSPGLTLATTPRAIESTGRNDFSSDEDDTTETETEGDFDDARESVASASRDTSPKNVPRSGFSSSGSITDFHSMVEDSSTDTFHSMAEDSSDGGSSSGGSIRASTYLRAGVKPSPSGMTRDRTISSSRHPQESADREVEKIVYVDREVERIVERIVEVPVDRIIYVDRVPESTTTAGAVIEGLPPVLSDMGLYRYDAGGPSMFPPAAAPGSGDETLSRSATSNAKTVSTSTDTISSSSPSPSTSTIARTPMPTFVSPPPPNMPPPIGLPVKKISPPPARPFSPPPADLYTRSVTPVGRARLGSPLESARSPSQSMPPPTVPVIRTIQSTSEFRSSSEGGWSSIESSKALSEFGAQSTGSLEARSNVRRRADIVIGSSASIHSHRSHRSREPSTVSSRSSDGEYDGPGLSQDMGAHFGSGGPNISTDPSVIFAITQTMIGEFLYKYTRKAMGKGHSDKRHRRFFWVHPYTKTLYWSSSDPGSSGVQESTAKSGTHSSSRFRWLAPFLYG